MSRKIFLCKLLKKYHISFNIFIEINSEKYNYIKILFKIHKNMVGDKFGYE